MVIIIGLAALVVWGFVEGRGEVEREAERERPVKEPLRVSEKNGVQMITLDDHTQQSSGIETTLLMSARPRPNSPQVPFRERTRCCAAPSFLAASPQRVNRRHRPSRRAWKKLLR
jgi:hypothetical protein